MRCFEKLFVTVLFMVSASFMPTENASAQDPVTEVIRQAVVKAIKAVDLQVQRLQTKTIWLQNAQKVVENKMSELELNQITDWVDKQKDLYSDYFDELWKVKNAVSYFHRIREVMTKQVMLVNEYKRAFTLFRKDIHFTTEEIRYISEVYSGIISESLKELDQLDLVVNSFSTQMSDAKRLEIINQVADKIDERFTDMKSFERENIAISLHRSKDEQEIRSLKSMYGLK